MGHVEARRVRDARSGIDRLGVEAGDDAFEIADGAVEERSRHAGLHRLECATPAG